MRWGQLHTVFLVFLLAVTAGCKKKTDWSISFDEEDKNPYGSYIAFQSLPHYFPGATIKKLPYDFSFDDADEEIVRDTGGHSLVVILCKDFKLTASEWEHLCAIAGDGNEVFVFAHTVDPMVTDYFGIKEFAGQAPDVPPGYPFNKLADNLGSLKLARDTTVSFGYRGRFINNYLAVDTAYDLEILGYNKAGHPDFVRFPSGEGHITLHVAPLSMTNYFLLQDNNRRYLDGIWAGTDKDIRYIYWHSFIARETEGRNFDALMKHPATRNAVLLAIAALLLYTLFNLKRKQRVIPVIETPENSSVAFAETIGMLYYNKGDNNNLAQKMVQHYLEWVRQHYFLNTNQINDIFTQQLAIKSGLPEQSVAELVQMIHEVRLGSTPVDDAYLLRLYQSIQQFYKQHN